MLKKRRHPAVFSSPLLAGYRAARTLQACLLVIIAGVLLVLTEIYLCQNASNRCDDRPRMNHVQRSEQQLGQTQSRRLNAL